MASRPFAVVSLLLAVGFWGTSFPLTRAVVTEVPPIFFALLRFVIASAALVPLVARTRELPRPMPLGILSLMGLTGITIYFLAFNVALNYTTAIHGALIESAAAPVTVLLSWWLIRDKPSLSSLFGIAIAITGVFIILTSEVVDPSASNPRLGNFLMVVTVVAWGLYGVLGKKVADLDSLVVTTVSLVIGTLMLIPPAIIEILYHGIPSLSARVWAIALYLGIFPSAIAYLLYNYGLKFVSAPQAANFLNLIPVFGVAVSVLILHENTSSRAIFGGILAVIGVSLSAHVRAADPQKH